MKWLPLQWSCLPKSSWMCSMFRNYITVVISCCPLREPGCFLKALLKSFRKVSCCDNIGGPDGSESPHKWPSKTTAWESSEHSRDYQGQPPDLELKISFVNYIKYVSTVYSFGDEIKILMFSHWCLNNWEIFAILCGLNSTPLFFTQVCNHLLLINLTITFVNLS